MSIPAPTRSLDALPNELIFEIFDNIDILKNGPEILLIGKEYYQIALQTVNRQAEARMKKGWDTSNGGKDVIIKDLDLKVVGVCKRKNLTPLHQLIRIERREEDYETLCYLFENLLSLRTYCTSQAYEAMCDSRLYLADLGTLFQHSECELLDMYHALENCHYKEFASIDRINRKVSNWSETQLLKFALMSQSLGRFLYIVQGAERRPPADKVRSRFEYMQAAKLVLLLWGARPIMRAIFDAIKGHTSKDLRNGLLEGMESRIQAIRKDLRQSRSMAPGMRDSGWQWTTLSVERNTFNRALWHVRTSNLFLEGVAKTPAHPALFTGLLPIGDGPEQFSRQLIVGELGRPDLLVDGRMAHMMDNSEWTWLEDPYHLRNAIEARKHTG